jgi:hypothetical protein
MDDEEQILPMDFSNPLAWWNTWLAMAAEWQAQWLQAWLGGGLLANARGPLPGLSAGRPTVPLLWDPGFFLPRVDARVTPVATGNGDDAARVSMMIRLPRFGCVGPADVLAVEAFVARRPDPGVLPDAAHPQAVLAPPASASPASVAPGEAATVKAVAAGKARGRATAAKKKG